MTTVSLEPVMAADAAHPVFGSNWSSSEENIYIAITKAWFRLLKPEERRKHPLRRYVVDRDFVKTLVSTGVDLGLIASICARLACRHPSNHDGALSTALKRSPSDALDPAVAWWRPLDGPEGIGIHYVELGGGTLEFLSIARCADRPNPRDSR